jgi:hypothetical protein
MTANKLLGRIEEISWEPPTLSFIIERHGGMTYGSSRAELQYWSIDVDEGTAAFGPGSYRQKRPRQPPLDVKPLAREVADLIENGISDERLEWGKDEVRVQIGKIIPSEYQPKETLTGRRKRFRKALSEELEPKGWIQVRPNSFRRHQVTG